MTESEQSDIPSDIWDQAVAEVDGEHGYTVEHASDPAAHRTEYAERAEQIADNVGRCSWIQGLVCI